jgi:mannan endo-1,4-beta-mannosidase
VSGQTDYQDVEWIEKTTGKAPLILALDFMHTPKRVGGTPEDVSQALAWARRGGIVAYQWHWVSPTKARDLGKGFYTGSTEFDLAFAIDHPETEDYKQMLVDIDDVATSLKALERAGVPVLFRPLHEAQGAWFWWGAKGAAPCKNLYNLIFDRITAFHHIHNVAWVWNVYPASQNKGNPVDWYPGNERVDVVATDYLQGKNDYDDLSKLCSGRKIIGVAETMNPPDPGPTIAAGAPWAYWVTWARRDWNGKSAGDVVKAINDPLTVTLEHH